MILNGNFREAIKNIEIWEDMFKDAQKDMIEETKKKVEKEFNNKLKNLTLILEKEEDLDNGKSKYKIIEIKNNFDGFTYDEGDEIELDTIAENEKNEDGYYEGKFDKANITWDIKE